MAFAEDFSVFFSIDEFADAATWTASGGEPAEGAVIFDRNGLVLEEFGVDTASPAAVCPATQWPAAASGDALTIHLAGGDVHAVLRAVTPLRDGAIVLLTLAIA